MDTPRTGKEEEQEAELAGAEGDEVMEEAEEQEEGYSACLFSIDFNFASLHSSHPFSFSFHNLVYAVSPSPTSSFSIYAGITHGSWLSIVDPNIDIDLDQLVLLSSRTRIFLRSL